MESFSYKAIDYFGVEVKGLTQGEDEASVYNDLGTRGLLVLSVEKQNLYIANLKKYLQSWSVKRTDIIEFAGNLSMMMKAGVPVLNAIEDLATTLDNKAFKRVLQSIKHEIEMGMRFSDAVELNKQYFPDIFIKLIKIGEESGQLDNSLSDIATHLQRMEDLSAAIKRALMYPAFAVVTTVGALVFWLAYVLPKIVPLLKDMGVKLPMITLILIQVSDFTNKFWYLFLLLPIIIFAAVKILKRAQGVEYALDMLKIKIPIIKGIIYNKLLTVFSEQFRILIAAGIPIDRSFDIVAEVIGNKVFEKAIIESKEKVVSGDRISDSLKEHKVFPPLVIRMLDIGESTGNLDNQFGFLSEHYLKKLDDVSIKLGKTLEPVIMVVIGGLFGIIIMGLMLPIYSLVSSIGKG